jgi:OmpA-OmpF porin, OOP family
VSARFTLGRPAAFAIAFGTFAVLAAPGARAQGMALQQHEPAPAGDTFFAVPNGRVRGLMEAYASLIGSYAHRPTRGTATPQGQEYIRTQLYGHLDATLSLAEALMLSADLPFALVQSGDTEDFSERPAEGGKLADPRLTLRITGLADHWKTYALGAQVDVWIPIGSEDFLAGDGQVRANPKLALSGEVGNFVYAASAGYLFRKHQAFPRGEIGGAITFGAGAAILLARKALQVGPEIYGNTVTESELFADRSTPVELLLGIKYRIGFVVLGVGAGPGLTEAPGTAAFRGVASVTLSHDERVLDRDGDGLYDDHDVCPDDPGFEAKGCPAPDQDQDTVPDSADACRDRAGLVHADPKKHGCPPG